MKVLFVNSVCGIGSTGRICTDLSAVLEEQADEAKIAYGRDAFVPKQFQKFGVRIGSDRDVKVHAVMSRLFDNHGFYSSGATKTFLNWIQIYNPDIIHLHNIHGYYLNIEVLFDFLKKWDKPIVWTLHDAWPFTGHCVYFDYVGCYKWKTQCEHCPQKKTYPASILLDRSRVSYRRKRIIFTGVKKLYIVTPSVWLAHCVGESFLSEYKITVINNGIDTEVFKPKKNNLRVKNSIGNKKIVLGISMGWPPHKHLDYMIKLANDLGRDYQVVLLGLSKEQMNDIPNNIIGFQKTRNVDELVEWYSAADVYVNPTMEDNYPTVNLEAQACGTPVVTFNSGGSAECIKEGYGIIVERGNYQELLEATIKACKIKGSAPIPHITSKKEFASNYLKLYRSILI